MIKLQKLELNNFRSWKHLEIGNFSNLGLVLIVGENGSGKSSIRQAVEYIITDSFSDKISLDDMSFNGRGNCCLYGKFLKENNVIEIWKYRDDKKHKNDIVLKLNDEDVSSNLSRTETQKKFEQILGINPSTLFISSIFSSSSTSFIESDEATRKEILYNYLNLDKYNDYFTKTKEKHKESINADIKVDAEIGKIQENITSTALEVDGLLNDIEEWSEKNKDKIKEVEEEIDSLERFDTTKMKEDLNELESKLQNIDIEEVGRWNLRIKADQETKYKMEVELKVLQEKLSDCTKSMCPILKEECNTLKNRNEKVLDKYIEEKKNLIESKKALEEGLEFAKQEYEKGQTILEENERINDEIAALKSNIHETELENKHIKEKKKSLLRRIDELKEEENPYIGFKVKCENKIEDLQNRLDNHFKEKEIIKEYIQIYEFWCGAFSRKGIPNLKIEKVLGDIEDKINEYLGKINSHSYVSLSAQSFLKSGDSREKISYKINDPTKSISNYNSFSSGERQRAKFSDIMAFAQVMGDFDFMILDEIADLSMDDEGKSSVLQLLYEKVTEIGSLFVVSHSNMIKSANFNKVFKIKKKDGVSCLT